MSSSSFEQAFEITMGHEGLYSNDPQDPGGETYRGIARRYWPKWSGWTVIDALVKKGGVVAVPRQGVNEQLDQDVEDFYKENFWDPFEGDDCPDQPIANEIFDTGVNMSLTRPIEFLQEALTITNRNDPLRYWDDLSIDGQWGPKTKSVLGTALARNHGELIYKLMNVLQGEFYINKMRNNPAKERWIGWFNRVTISK